MTSPANPHPDEAATAVAALDQARAGLLGGRGPGASDAEVARHTRARLRTGGHPTTEQRAVLADRTARAAGNPDALTAQVAVDAATLGDTIAAIRHRVDPARAVAGVRIDLTTLALLLAAAITATAVVVRRSARRERR